MLYDLDMGIIWVPKFPQPMSALLLSATATSFKKFQVRTIEARLAGREIPSSPSLALATLATIELSECPRRRRENLA